MRPASCGRGSARKGAAATERVVAALVRSGLLLAVGCSDYGRDGATSAPADGGAPTAGAGSAAGAPNGAFAGAGGGAPASGTGGATAGSASGGGAGRPDFTSLIPARIRRLASAEYDASVQALLSTSAAPASGPDFPPDLRQDGFTVNDAQRVDALIVERLADAALALASEAQANGTLARLAPCDATADATDCAKSFSASFGAKLYRRPLDADELDGCASLYAVGADGATYLDGIAHVTRGLLQSAGFLYLTELGASAPVVDGPIELTPREIAASLSYFLTSAPPDDELVAKALAGALSDPGEREAQARRLLRSEPRAKDTLVRLVREWLGIDGVTELAKDSLVYPAFAGEKSRIVAESSDFVRAVAFESTGTVSELFGARWTVNSGPLALYEPAGSGPI